MPWPDSDTPLTPLSKAILVFVKTNAILALIHFAAGIDGEPMLWLLVAGNVIAVFYAIYAYRAPGPAAGSSGAAPPNRPDD